MNNKTLVPSIQYTSQLKEFDAKLTQEKPSDDKVSIGKQFLVAMYEICSHNNLSMPPIHVVPEDDGLVFHILDTMLISDAGDELGINLTVDNIDEVPDMRDRFEEIISRKINIDCSLYDTESVVSYVNTLNNVEMIEQYLMPLMINMGDLMLSNTDGCPYVLLEQLINNANEAITLNNTLNVKLYHKTINGIVHVFPSKYTMDHDINPTKIESLNDIMYMLDRIMRFCTLPTFTHNDEKIKSSKATLAKFDLNFYRDWHNDVYNKLGYDLVSLNKYFMDNFLENNGIISARLINNDCVPKQLTEAEQNELFKAAQETICSDMVNMHNDTPYGSMFTAGEYLRDEELKKSINVSGNESIASRMDITPIAMLVQYFDENQQPMIRRTNSLEDIAKIPDGIKLTDENLMIALMLSDNGNQHVSIVKKPKFVKERKPK